MEVAGQFHSLTILYPAKKLGISSECVWVSPIAQKW